MQDMKQGEFDLNNLKPLHRKPDLSLNFGCNHTLGDHSSNCGYNRGCKEPGYNRRSN